MNGRRTMSRTTLKRGMVTLASLLSLLAVPVAPGTANAQEPAIISEQLQKLAVQYKLSEALNIRPAATTAPSWERVDTTRYVDILAAVETMAAQRASNLRRNPGKDDYDAVLAAICLWPNKPPGAEGIKTAAEEFRRALAGTYFLVSKREALRNAMRPLLLTGSPEAIGKWTAEPTRNPLHFREVLIDTSRLR